MRKPLLVFMLSLLVGMTLRECGSSVRQQVTLVETTHASPVRPAAHLVSAVLWAIGAHGPTWVAVGEDGALLVTTNQGQTWEYRDTGMYSSLTDVDNNEKTWVAVGYGGIVTSSDDGVSWNTLPIGHLDGFSSLRSVANNGDVWLAVGHAPMLAVDRAYNVMVSKDNGQTWSPKYTGKRENFNAIAQHEGRWIAVGEQGAIALTDDKGQEWRTGLSASKKTLNAIAYGNGRWLAVGDQGVAIVSSDKGESWQPIRGLDTSADLRAVVYSRRGWVAAGAGGAVYISDEDGTKWNRLPAKTSDTITSLYDNSGEIVGATGRGAIFSTRSLGATLRYSRPSPERHYPVSHAHEANGVWVGVGAGGMILTSTNGGANWKRANVETDANLNAVFYSDRRWVAVGEKGVAVVSVNNGRSWKQVPTGTTSALKTLWYADGTWVASGSDVTIFSKAPERSWQNATVIVHDDGYGSKYLQRALGYYEKRWLSVGTRIFVSNDGAQTWVEKGSRDLLRGPGIFRFETESLNALSGGTGGTGGAGKSRKWIAVGTNGTVVLSADNGETWKRAGTPVEADLFSVGEQNGRWVAAGGSSTILVSDDGNTWFNRAGTIIERADTRFWRTDVPAVVQRVEEAPLYDLKQVIPWEGAWYIIGSINNSDENDWGPGILASLDGWNWTPLTRKNMNFVTSTPTTPIQSFIFGSEEVIQIAPGRPLPYVAKTSVAKQYSGSDRISFDIRGDLEDCKDENVPIKVYAENEHNVKNQHPLKEVGTVSLKAGGNKNIQSGSIDVDLSQKLGLAAGQPYYYAIEVGCNNWTVRYPRNALGILMKYSPWYQHLTFTSYALLGAIALVGTILTAYLVRPLWLLSADRFTSNLTAFGDLQLPFVGLKVSHFLHLYNLFLIPLLVTRPRTLDAWVRAHVPAWKEIFEQEATPRRCNGYVSLPCRLDDPEQGELIQRPDMEFMSRLFRTSQYIEIVGVGGSGKTMLAVQSCRWLLTTASSARVPMLPILMEEETSDLFSTIKRKLSRLNSDISDPFLAALIKKGRILPVFDRLSERGSKTIQYVCSLNENSAVGAFLITTRYSLEYGGIRVRRLFPLPLRAESMMLYMSALLSMRKEHDLLASMTEQTALSTYLVRMIKHGDEEIPLTPLLVRLFVEQAVELAKNRRGFDALPASVPEAYFRYLREVNPKGRDVPNAITDDCMFAVAIFLAESALNDNYVPQDIERHSIRQDLERMRREYATESDPVERLKLNGILVEREVGARNVIAFALDPIAEYLAADGHLRRCAGDAQKEAALFEKVRARGEPAKSFLLALELTRQFYQA